MLAPLVCVGSWTASAADLGGNCCADLEERIAELEATTARKGNRKVSLTISGHVNEAVTWWDDGFESNVYVGTNDTAQSRFRFLGDAKITGDWSAGYLLELGVYGANLGSVDQDNDNGTSGANGVSVRHSAWYLASKSLGKLWVGQTSQATDGITEINLANTNHFAGAGAWGDTFGDNGRGFFLRRSDGVLLNGANALQWGDFVAQGSSESFAGEGGRFNVVKYDSPAFGGFTFSSSWGEDDLWDVALRYKGEFGGFKLAAGIGYGEVTDQNAGPGRRGIGDIEELGLSASIMHVATGLYASGAFGTLEDDGIPAGFDNETDSWTIQAGIEQKFFPIGKTTIFGEYFQLDRGLGATISGPFNAAQVASLGVPGATVVEDSEITGWSVGVNQNLNEVIDLYLIYRHVDLDVNTDAGAADLEDMQFLTAGGYIKF